MTDQESTPSPETLDAPVQETTTATNDFDSLPEWAREQIKSLRRESADRRTKLSAYEKAEQEREQANQSEIEKANAAATKANERAAALEARICIEKATAALERASFLDAELGLLLIRDKIKVEDGEPINIPDLVADLVKAKPHLVKPVAPVVPDTKPTAPAAKQDTAPRQRAWGKI